MKTTNLCNECKEVQEKVEKDKLKWHQVNQIIHAESRQQRREMLGEIMDNYGFEWAEEVEQRVIKAWRVQR